MEKEQEIEELKAIGNPSEDDFQKSEDQDLPTEWESKLAAKDNLIDEMKEEIQSLKDKLASEDRANLAEEVYGEPLTELSQEDWLSTQQEINVVSSEGMAYVPTGMEKETKDLQVNFAEIGVAFDGNMKEFLPASVYAKLESMENSLSIERH